jgi:hypothetical protein
MKSVVATTTFVSYSVCEYSFVVCKLTCKYSSLKKLSKNLMQDEVEGNNVKQDLGAIPGTLDNKVEEDVVTPFPDCEDCGVPHQLREDTNHCVILGDHTTLQTDLTVNVNQCDVCGETAPWCFGGDTDWCLFGGRKTVLDSTGHRVLAGRCCPMTLQQEGETCGSCGRLVGPPPLQPLMHSSIVLAQPIDPCGRLGQLLDTTHGPLIHNVPEPLTPAQPEDALSMQQASEGPEANTWLMTKDDVFAGQELHPTTHSNTQVPHSGVELTGQLAKPVASITTAPAATLPKLTVPAEAFITPPAAVINQFAVPAAAIIESPAALIEAFAVPAGARMTTTAATLRQVAQIAAEITMSPAATFNQCQPCQDSETPSICEPNTKSTPDWYKNCGRNKHRSRITGKRAVSHDDTPPPLENDMDYQKERECVTMDRTPRFIQTLDDTQTRVEETTTQVKESKQAGSHTPTMQTEADPEINSTPTLQHAAQSADIHVRAAPKVDNATAAHNALTSPPAEPVQVPESQAINKTQTVPVHAAPPLSSPAAVPHASPPTDMQDHAAQKAGKQSAAHMQSDAPPTVPNSMPKQISTMGTQGVVIPEPINTFIQTPGVQALPRIQIEFLFRDARCALVQQAHKIIPPKTRFSDLKDQFGRIFNVNPALLHLSHVGVEHHTKRVADLVAEQSGRPSMVTFNCAFQEEIRPHIRNLFTHLASGDSFHDQGKLMDDLDSRRPDARQWRFTTTPVNIDPPPAKKRAGATQSKINQPTDSVQSRKKATKAKSLSPLTEEDYDSQETMLMSSRETSDDEDTFMQAPDADAPRKLHAMWKAVQQAEISHIKSMKAAERARAKRDSAVTAFNASQKKHALQTRHESSDKAAKKSKQAKTETDRVHTKTPKAKSSTRNVKQDDDTPSDEAQPTQQPEEQYIQRYGETGNIRFLENKLQEHLKTKAKVDKVLHSDDTFQSWLEENKEKLEGFGIQVVENQPLQYQDAVITNMFEEYTDEENSTFNRQTAEMKDAIWQAERHQANLPNE